MQHPRLPSEFPALKSLDSIALPNNLPQQVTSFIGREKELSDVQELLSKTRLLTLTGAGGSGKSRLSLQAAADLLEQFPDGAFLVELAPLANPALVAQTVANVLGVKEENGIPLAIELAAARARSLSLEDINGKLDQRFRLLTGGSQTALPRQQTLHSLIDWSYDLLSAAEKALLCRLSVFAGGWLLDAAEAVCAGEDVEDWEVLDLLTSLCEKALWSPSRRGRRRATVCWKRSGSMRLTGLGRAAQARRFGTRTWPVF